ncbi:hypothetical protein X975_06175, partial [Stegodyphus mimosarum]
MKNRRLTCKVAYLPAFPRVKIIYLIGIMAAVGADDVKEEFIEELAKNLPEGMDMEEFVANITKMAKEFMAEQGQKPIEMQILLFFVFLMIPLSLILFCFCKILSSQRRR